MTGVYIGDEAYDLVSEWPLLQFVTNNKGELRSLRWFSRVANSTKYWVTASMNEYVELTLEASFDCKTLIDLPTAYGIS